MTINNKIMLNGLKKDLPSSEDHWTFFQTDVIDCETKEDFFWNHSCWQRELSCLTSTSMNNDKDGEALKKGAKSKSK